MTMWMQTRRRSWHGRWPRAWPSKTPEILDPERIIGGGGVVFLFRNVSEYLEALMVKCVNPLGAWISSAEGGRRKGWEVSG